MFRIKLFSVAVIGVMALMSCGLAVAAEKPSAYQGAGGNVQQGVKGGSAVLGSLPFTGLDLALIVGGGLVLVIAGLTVRRAAGRRA